MNEHEIRRSVAIVLENTEEWDHDGDDGDGRGRTYYCPSCRWSSRDATKKVHGRAVLEHKPGCELRAAIETLRAFVDEGG